MTLGNMRANGVRPAGPGTAAAGEPDRHAMAMRPRKRGRSGRGTPETDQWAARRSTFKIRYLHAIGAGSPAIKGRAQSPRDINSRPAPRRRPLPLSYGRHAMPTSVPTLNSNPTFEARPLTSASGWYVRVAWLSGKRDHIPGFVSQREAQQWIEGKAPTWLSAQSKATEPHFAFS